MSQTIRTDRLLLRPFAPMDATAFSAYRSDPDVARFQGWTAPFSLTEAESLVAEFARADERADGWFQWAIELPDQPGIIGDVGVNRHPDRQQATIGYTLASAYQGKGYAAEAVGRIVGRLFAEGLHRVSAECDVRNAGSIGLLTRLGFRREGHLLESTWAAGEWTDDFLYAVLASEWQQH